MINGKAKDWQRKQCCMLCMLSFSMFGTLNQLYIFVEQLIHWSHHYGKIIHESLIEIFYAMKKLKLPKVGRLWLLLNYFAFMGSAFKPFLERIWLKYTSPRSPDIHFFALAYKLAVQN